MESYVTDPATVDRRLHAQQIEVVMMTGDAEGPMWLSRQATLCSCANQNQDRSEL
jgi:hypothetical protein